MGSEFYSLTSTFEHRLAAPAGFPAEVLIRGDAGADADDDRDRDGVQAEPERDREGGGDQVADGYAGGDRGAEVALEQVLHERAVLRDERLVESEVGAHGLESRGVRLLAGQCERGVAGQCADADEHHDRGEEERDQGLPQPVEQVGGHHCAPSTKPARLRRTTPSANVLTPVMSSE